MLWKRDNSADLYLVSGRITGYSWDAGSSTSILNTSGVTYKAGWDAEKFLAKSSTDRRAILLPNVRKFGSSYPVIAVNDPDPDTITVKGNVTSAYAYIAPPTDFAIIYGQYIRQYITAGGTGYAVKFFDETGIGSFVDSDTSYNGICQVCHGSYLLPGCGWRYARRRGYDA